MALERLLEAFVLGLLTPLTAVCVLPLYPAFLSFLSNKLTGKSEKKTVVLFGLIISLGVILFMLLLGLLFTTLFQISLTNVISIVSPIAFGILALISILLLFDLDFSRVLPKLKLPTAKNPLWSAFIFGFFFGGIIIPCNPAFIAVFLVRTASVLDFLSNMLNFLSFGFGIAFPLLVLAIISATWSQVILSFLTKHKSIINRTAGLIMLIISIYYLVFVFRLFG